MKWKQWRKITTQYNQSLPMWGSVGQAGTQTGTGAHEQEDSYLQGKQRCLEHTLLSQLR